MYLIDTNVFLEIVLAQQKRQICKRFLDANMGNLYVSDFSLHSIGVILFKNNKEDIFQKFAIDVIPKIRIITLPEGSYWNLSQIKKDLRLDFDDVYQFAIAEYHSLKIVTMEALAKVLICHPEPVEGCSNCLICRNSSTSSE